MLSSKNKHMEKLLIFLYFPTRKTKNNYSSFLSCTMGLQRNTWLLLLQGDWVGVGIEWPSTLIEFRSSTHPNSYSVWWFASRIAPFGLFVSSLFPRGWVVNPSARSSLRALVVSTWTGIMFYFQIRLSLRSTPLMAWYKWECYLRRTTEHYCRNLWYSG